MSGGGTQTTVTQAADPWYKDQSYGLYQQAGNYLTNTPYRPYPGSTVAGFQPLQTAAQDYLSQAFLGQSAPYRAPETGGPYTPRMSPYWGPFGAMGPQPTPTTPPAPPRPPTPQIPPDAGVESPLSPEQAELERVMGLLGGGGPSASVMPYSSAPSVNYDSFIARNMTTAPVGELVRLDNGDYFDQAGYNQALQAATATSGVNATSGALSGYPNDWRTQFPGPYPAGMPVWLDSWGPMPSQVYYGIPGGGYTERTYGDPTPIVDPVPGGSPPNSTWPGVPTPTPPPNAPPVEDPRLPKQPKQPGLPPVYGVGGGTGIGEAQDAASIARQIAFGGGGYPLVNPMTAGFERVSPTTVGAPQIAASAAGWGGNVGSRDVQTGNVLGGMSGYRNAYEDEVVGRALSDIDRSRQLAQNQNASNAALSGAFGGDRAAIVEAETNRAYADQAARTAAQLRAQGFDRAADLAQQDAGRGLSAGIANQGASLQAGLANQAQYQDLTRYNAGLGQQATLANQSAALQAALANQGVGLQAGLANQGAGVQTGLANQAAGLQGQLANQNAWFTGQGQQLQGAGLLGSLGGDIFNRTMGVGSALSALGAEQQGQAQDEIAADVAQFYEAEQYVPQQLQYLQGLLMGVPQGMSQTSYVPRNRAGGFAGGALAGAGIGSAFGPWGTGIGAGIGGLLGLF